ncbi:hypothetical protein JDV02_009979 [Purpureocillium takamizusanense]|uniref:Zn(2)-C6 fungal-type domain-containing protein n=1 Tax=Purpureocillium takamizusanense TaxID=2060973 RepID=A0A9Q8VG34_9HYPO|nr:uncharacterized protein JDV02_009979 [Purpureocillium takamizusanense]UNI24213.1 hypothetical protein JDV02_009979 [Purpureocillium takamizusanense]
MVDLQAKGGIFCASSYTTEHTSEQINHGSRRPPRILYRQDVAPPAHPTVDGATSERAMFGTWKYDPETDQMRNLRRAYDPITARSWQHQACNRCHEKKLRCSGRRAGCDRCTISGSVCAYDRSGGSLRASGGVGGVGSRKGANARVPSSSFSSFSLALPSGAGKVRARNGSASEARCGTVSALYAAAAAEAAAALAQQRSSPPTKEPASRAACRQVDFATGSGNGLQMDPGGGDPGQRQRQQVTMGGFGSACFCGLCCNGCAWIAAVDPGASMTAAAAAAAPELVSGWEAASFGGNHQQQLYNSACGVAVGRHAIHADQGYLWRQSR